MTILTTIIITSCMRRQCSNETWDSVKALQKKFAYVCVRQWQYIQVKMCEFITCDRAIQLRGLCHGEKAQSAQDLIDHLCGLPGPRPAHVRHVGCNMGQRTHGAFDVSLGAAFPCLPPTIPAVPRPSKANCGYIARDRVLAHYHLSREPFTRSVSYAREMPSTDRMSLHL